MIALCHPCPTRLGKPKYLFILHLQPPSTWQSPSRQSMNICPLNSRALDTRIKPSLSWSLSGFRVPAATDKVCPQHRGSPFLLTCHRHFVPKGNWPSGCPVHRVSEVKEVTDNKKRSQASCVQMLAPAGSRVVQVSAVHQECQVHCSERGHRGSDRHGFSVLWGLTI